MNIFDQQKKTLADQRRPITTVIKVIDFQLGEDKSKHRIIGQDLYSTDENGIPKTVSVAIQNRNNNGIRGVSNFAKRGDLVHTEKGGLIRLDRAIKRAGGEEYVAPHAQRLSMSSDMLRQDENGKNYKIAFVKSYVKVVPIMDRATGQPREFATSKQGLVIHRGSVMIIPEENASSENAQKVPMGKDFKDSLIKLAKAAIEAAPEKTQPFVMLRDPDPKNVSEMRIPNIKKNERGDYVEMTKQEMLDAFMQTPAVQAIMPGASALTEGEVEGVHGFVVNVFGNPYDESGERTVSRVESMANETLRRFPRPDLDNQRQEPVKGNQEYALGIASYTIPQEGSGSANLESLGRMPGVKATPNAGLSATPNPYWPTDEDGNMVSFTTSVAAQPAPKTAEPAATTNQQAVAAQAPISRPAPEPESDEPPLPSDADMDAYLGADSDFDMDELESQMSSQGL